jgi:hypothetical protein
MNTVVAAACSAVHICTYVYTVYVYNAVFYVYSVYMYYVCISVKSVFARTTKTTL